MAIAIFSLGEAEAKKKKPAKDPQEEVAKSAFHEGMKLFSQDKYAEALERFEFSYLTYPNPNVLFNIAMCQKALYRFADSIETFRRFLTKGGEKIPEKHKKAVEVALQDLDVLVARVRLEEVPPDAEVEVNGEAVGTTSQDDPLVLDPGQYEIIIRKPGYEPLYLKIDAAAGAELTIATPMKLEGSQTGAQATESGGAQEKDGGLRPLTVAAIGAGVAGLGMGAVGTVMLVKSNKLADTMDEERTNPDSAPYEQAEEDYQSARKWMIISYSIAGALIATGVVLFVLDRKKAKKDKVVTFAPFAGGIVMTF